MQEVELKLQVPAESRRAVDAEVAGRTPAHRQRLRAAYADTPDAALAEAQIALRVRREGRHWVQTLKGAGAHALERFEHNVPLQGLAVAPPPFDPELHRGTLVGDRLLTLLERETAPLCVRYETDVQRRTRLQRVRGAQIELAFDTGEIRSGDFSWPLCELELELKAGDAAAVLQQAHRWIVRHGLWVDTRSKAERGELLARGTRIGPARTGRATELQASMTPAEAWRCVARECTGQILANASQIASGEFGDEHVHQLRVGLRRLRGAMQLFDFVDGREQRAAAISEPAAELFRALGVARDRTVIEGGLGLELGKAFGMVEAAAQSSGDGAAQTPAEKSAASSERLAADAQAVCEGVRSAKTQALLLALLSESLGATPSARDEPAPPSSGDAPGDSGDNGSAQSAQRTLVNQVTAKLKRWHEQAARDAKRYAELDDAHRHSLRKRIKRLRYALEFCGDLYDRKAVRRYLKPLKSLQEQLGSINDVTVAMTTLREVDADHPHEALRWFGLGWLSARRDALIAQAAPALKAYSKSLPFWRGR